jgi:hypothetical protein
MAEPRYQDLADLLNRMIAGPAPRIKITVDRDDFTRAVPGLHAEIETADERKPPAFIFASGAKQLIRDLYRDSAPIFEKYGWDDPAAFEAFADFALPLFLRPSHARAVSEFQWPPILEEFGPVYPHERRWTPSFGGSELWSEIRSEIIEPRRQFLTVYPDIVTNGHFLAAVVRAEEKAGKLTDEEASDILLENKDPGQQYSDDSVRWINDYRAKKPGIEEAIWAAANVRGDIKYRDEQLMVPRLEGRLRSLTTDVEDDISEETVRGVSAANSKYPVLGGVTTTKAQDTILPEFEAVSKASDLEPVVKKYLFDVKGIDIDDLQDEAHLKTLTREERLDADATVLAFQKLLTKTKNNWTELATVEDDKGAIAAAIEEFVYFEMRAPFGVDKEDALGSLTTAATTEWAEGAGARVTQMLIDNGIPKANISAADYAEIVRIAQTLPLIALSAFVQGNKATLMTSKADAAAAAKEITDAATILAARNNPELGKKLVKEHLGKLYGTDAKDVPDSITDRLYQAFRDDGPQGLNALTDPTFSALGGLAPDGGAVITKLYLEQAIRNEKPAPTTAEVSEAVKVALRSATVNGQRAPILAVDVSSQYLSMLEVYASYMSPDELASLISRTHYEISNSKVQEAIDKAAAAERQQTAAAIASAQAAEGPSKQTALNRIWKMWNIEQKDVPSSIVSELGAIFANEGPEGLDAATSHRLPGAPAPEYTEALTRQLMEKERREKEAAGLGDAADPALKDALRQPLIDAYNLDFGADGFADHNVGRYFENVLLPQVAEGLARDMRDNPTRYAREEFRSDAINRFVRAFSTDELPGEGEIVSEFGTPFTFTEGQEKFASARTTTKQGRALNYLSSLYGDEIQNTGDTARDWDFAISRFGEDKLNRLAEQSQESQTFQLQQQFRPPGGSMQKPIQHPRTQVDPITGETRTFGYGDFPYSMPNTLEMQELLGDVATDDPEYLSFLIGSKDAPGPAFGLLERYPQLAGSFVKGERDKFREEAIQMSQARRGLGGGITYKDWEAKLAENQATIADEKARQRAEFAEINRIKATGGFAQLYGEFPTNMAELYGGGGGQQSFTTGGQEQAERWAAAAAITGTQEISSADYNIVGGFKSPALTAGWVEGEAGRSPYARIGPQMPTGSGVPAPPGSGLPGGPTYYDPIVKYMAQRGRDVKPPSFATMFGEREPEFRSQFEASPQFRLQGERREDEAEFERTRKLRRGRTFVI